MNLIHNQSILDLSLFHRTDINLYPLFIAIYEQKSISKAAHLLNITQSAASHALQRLRQLLHDDLFIRIGNQMRPTPFAEQSYPTIKQALIAIQNIAAEKQSFNPSTVQSVKIAVHDEIEPILFPQLVTHFHQQELNIQFLSFKLNRKTVVTDLTTQQIDFVIDLEQDFGEKIHFHPLIQDQFVVCSQHQYMDSDIYLAAQHIGVSSRRSGVLLEDLYLQRHHLSRNIFLRCQHYSTALEILKQHPNLIVTIPSRLLSHLNIPAGLQTFDLPFELPVLNMGIYWHKAMDFNLRHQFLKNEIFKNSA